MTATDLSQKMNTDMMMMVYTVNVNVTKDIVKL